MRLTRALIAAFGWEKRFAAIVCPETLGVRKPDPAPLEAAVAAAYPFREKIGDGMLKSHLRNAEKQGLGDYLRMKQFVHANTDGPDNPYAKVYDLRRIREDFPDFEVVESWREFMHAPPLPVHKVPGGRYLGWHLWVRLRPRRK